ncbi:MAG: GNAT family N-acetyltransferase [Cyclobacteriaceae bacterium]
MPVLPEKTELERVTLFKSRVTDAEEIFYAYASKPEATKYLSWKTHGSIDDTRTYLSIVEKTWKQGLQASFAVRLKKSHRLIGACGCTFSDGIFQVGYVFSPLFWGMGFATESCKGLIAEILKVKHVNRICSFVDVDNHASARVLEKSGFKQERVEPEYFIACNQGGIRKDARIFSYLL